MANDAFDLAAYLAALRERIDREMIAFLDAEERRGAGERLIDAMRYSLTAGGKRVRPILCCAAAQALGAEIDETLAAACAIEMVHTYSLIHDDLPAMDDDDLRRGKPTCHVAFDEATAILAGDALMALAFELIARHGYPSAGPSVRLEAIRILAAASGIHGMARGQMIDIESEGRRLGLDELCRLHALKTGAMIEASLVLGGLAAGADAARLEPLRRFGRAAGLAFQVVDDILNVEGDPAELGKSVGSDRARRKNSFPALLGLEKSKEFAHNLEQEAIAAIEALDRRADPLRAIAGYIVRRRR